MSAANIASTRYEIKNYGNRNVLRWQNIGMVLIVVFPCMLISTQLLFQQNALVFYY
jgi:hypothetical protein